MVIATMAHNMKTACGDLLAAWVSNSGFLTLMPVGECFEAWATERRLRGNERMTIVSALPRMVVVDPEMGVKTDQNANAFINDVEWKDVKVFDELPENAPEELRAIVEAVREAAETVGFKARA